MLTAVCLLAGLLLVLSGFSRAWLGPIRPSSAIQTTQATQASLASLGGSPGLMAERPASIQPGYVTADIETLRVGDTVLAMDPATGELRPRRIVDAFQRTTYRLRILTIRGPDGRELPPIRTTDEHPFWVVDADDFLPAGELEPGDRFQGPNGELQTLAATRAEEHPEGVTVYNFEVENAHTYFVLPGEQTSLHGSPVLVHNAVGGDCGIFKKPPGAGNKKGSYTITFKSGMKYHGKGPWSRALASARRISERAGDIAKKIDWKPARGNTNRQALIDEALRIDADGGISQS